MDPRKEYQLRLSDWSRRAQALEQSHLRMGNLRIFFVIGLFVLATVLCRSQVSIGFVLTILFMGLFLTGMWHICIENARDSARRAVRFYQSGIERLDGTWMGKGSQGMEFLDLRHPYAVDLDLFGSGSLFELLNAAHTQNGRVTLAAWLLEPAPPQEILARQEAIKELRPAVDLRERLGLLTAAAQAWIRTESLTSWARQPRVLKSSLVRITAFCLPWVSLFLVISGQWPSGLAVLVAQYVLASSYRKRVQQVTRSAGVAQQDLKWLAEVLDCLETEHFQSERLRRVDAGALGMVMS